MKTLSSKKLSVFVFALAFLGAGAVLWTIPYDEVRMLSWHFAVKWSIPSVLIGFIAVFIGKKYPSFSAMLITAGFVASVMARLFYDAAIDSTSHNLWPFEVAIAISIAFPTSFLASTIAYQVYKYKNKI